MTAQPGLTQDVLATVGDKGLTPLKLFRRFAAIRDTLAETADQQFGHTDKHRPTAAQTSNSLSIVVPLCVCNLYGCSGKASIDWTNRAVTAPA